MRHIISIYSKFLGSYTYALFYVDGSDALQEGDWLFHNRDAMSFLPWSLTGNAPDGGIDQNCLAVASLDPTSFNDYECTSQPQHNVYAICEHEGTVFSSIKDVCSRYIHVL